MRGNVAVVGLLLAPVVLLLALAFAGLTGARATCAPCHVAPCVVQYVGNNEAGTCQ